MFMCIHPPTPTVVVICASSHLTLFSVSDEWEVLKLVDDSISTLADRVAALNQVDLGAQDAQLNWTILGSFIAATVLFVVVVTVSELLGRGNVSGKGLFVKTGQIAKPQVGSFGIWHWHMAGKW